MNENVPKTSFDYLEGAFVRIPCAWIYELVMKSYYCFGRGLVFEQYIPWYMIPHIQQSTIEIEDLFVSIRSEGIAMEILNGDGNTYVCE